MKVVTFDRVVTVTVQGFPTVLQPGARWIFADETFCSLWKDEEFAPFIIEVSNLEPMLADIPTPKDWKGKRVLFYRGRGIGDQLICSAASRYFAEVLGAQCFQACEISHKPLWRSNPYVGTPISMPIPLDAVWRGPKVAAFFAKSFFLEEVTEFDSSSEQPNAYDRLFSLLGVDPETVADEYKRPVYELASEDIAAREAWMKTVGF